MRVPQRGQKTAVAGSEALHLAQLMLPALELLWSGGASLAGVAGLGTCPVGIFDDEYVCVEECGETIFGGSGSVTFGGGGGCGADERRMALKSIVSPWFGLPCGGGL